MHSHHVHLKVQSKQADAVGCSWRLACTASCTKPAISWWRSPIWAGQCLLSRPCRPLEAGKICFSYMWVPALPPSPVTVATNAQLPSCQAATMPSGSGTEPGGGAGVVRGSRQPCGSRPVTACCKTTGWPAPSGTRLAIQEPEEPCTTARCGAPRPSAPLAQRLAWGAAYMAKHHPGAGMWELWPADAQGAADVPALLEEVDPAETSENLVGVLVLEACTGRDRTERGRVKGW